MDNKLPVFRTFGNAIGFTLWNCWTIFRLTWFPFALLMTVTFGVSIFMQQFVSHTIADQTYIDPMGAFSDRFADFAFIQVVVIVLQMIAVAAAAVALHRVILFGDRRSGHYFSFAFGRTELLYALMAFVTGVIVLAILATVIGPVLFLVSNGDLPGFFAQFKDWPANAPKLVASGGFGALMGAYFVGWIIAVYFMLRLAVWPPAVVATNRFALGEAWSLSRGNVLRFFGLFLLTGIVIDLLLIIPVAAFFFYAAREGYLHMPLVPDPAALPDPSALPGPPPTAPNIPAPPDLGPLKPEDTAAMREAMRQKLDSQFKAFLPYAPLFWFAELLLYVYGTALGVALLSYSYKALKGVDAKEPLPSEG